MSVKLFRGLSFEPIIATTAAVNGLSILTTVPRDRVMATPGVNLAGTVTGVSPDIVMAPNLAGTVTTISPDIFIADVKITSGRSVLAPLSTIFDKFELKSEPVYNFFVEDETTNEAETVRKRALEDVPRYVKLTWKTAPKKRQIRYEMPDKRVKNPILTRGLDPTLDRTISAAGLTFTSPKLSVERAKLVTANGFIAPTSIRANVELNTDETFATGDGIDEDAFLLSDDGRSLNDLKSNIRSLETATIDSNAPVVENQFSVKRSLDAGSFVMRGIQPSSPALSIVAATAVDRSITVTSTKQVLAHVQEISALPASIVQMRRVTFVEPNITGIVSEPKVNAATRPEHVETMSTLASALPTFEALVPMLSAFPSDMSRVPSFPSTSRDGIEYVGYVIEKYKRTTSGMFSLLSEIHIDDISCGEFIDAGVVYGGVYRYRIKTILKWTHPANVTVLSTDLTDPNIERFSQTKPIAGNKDTYFDSDWGRKWAYAAIIDMIPPPPPDELIVRQSSGKKAVSVCWKMPENVQRDISGFQLFRKKADDAGHAVSDWEMVGPVHPARNGQFIDRDVEVEEKNGGLSYVYAAQTLTMHSERSALSDQILVKLSETAAELGEHEPVFFSEQGVDITMHGAYSVKPPRHEQPEIVIRDIFAIIGRLGKSKMMFDDKEYIVRVQSLDTGETTDLDVSFSVNNVVPRSKNSSQAPVSIVYKSS